MARNSRNEPPNTAGVVYASPASSRGTMDRSSVAAEEGGQSPTSPRPSLSSDIITPVKDPTESRTIPIDPGIGTQLSDQPVSSHPESDRMHDHTPSDLTDNVINQADSTWQKQNSASSRSCQCIDSILHVIERLDDNEFGIGSLPFDKVLKLQKWMVYQSLIPLQCDLCCASGRTQSMVMILCERIVEISRCLSKRLERLVSNLASYSAAATMDIFEVLQLPEILAGTHPSPLHGEEEYDMHHEADVDGLYSRVAPDCTLHLFSREFRAEYSSDEQCGMIQYLSKKQIETTMRLLERLRNAAGPGTWRGGKVTAMERRLRIIGESTQRSLDAIARAFE